MNGKQRRHLVFPGVAFTINASGEIIITMILNPRRRFGYRQARNHNRPRFVYGKESLFDENSLSTVEKPHHLKAGQEDKCEVGKERRREREGKKVGRKEGRKERRNEGRKERKEGRKQVRKEERNERRKERRKEEREKRQKERKKEVRKAGRKKGKNGRRGKEGIKKK